MGYQNPTTNGAMERIGCHRAGSSDKLSPQGWEPRMTTNPPQDPRIAAAIAGDTDALSALLREHGPRLREQLSIDSKWRSVLDADDVMQVTYMEAFLNIDKLAPGGVGAFFSWLRRIAENNLRDAIRALEAQRRPPPAVSLPAPASGDSVVALYDLLGATTTTPSRDAARREMATALDTALARMPEDYAAVIRAYDLEGQPIATVAARMGRSPAAVYMLRARAHDRLREVLGAETRFFSHSQ
jgi:RNA polymerase sigma-70 factor (ECF subfamily)